MIEDTTSENEQAPKRQGFASMSRERLAEIASKGGKSAHAKGTAHQWTSEQAKVAGRKGGTVSQSRRGRAAATG